MILVKLLKPNTAARQLSPNQPVWQNILIWVKFSEWIALDDWSAVLEFECFFRCFCLELGGLSVGCGRYHAKVKWGLSGLGWRLSICLNELLVGLDNPAACIDGQGGAFWARRGTEPKMQCSCLSILFAMIFGEYVSQGPFFQGAPNTC